MSRAVLVAACWLAVAPSAFAVSSKDLAEGRRHLHKANALAADAKCEAAVREYTFAYQKLHDPVVLFNRAECYRRLGQNDAAVSDYRAFLDAVPRAPNRAEVEARLAALEGGAAPPVVSPAPARPQPPAASLAAPAPAPSAPSAEVTPILPAPAAVPAPEPASPMVNVTAGSGATPAPATDSAGHGRLWLWAAIGAAVAGGAVGAYVALRPPGASPPSTQLGNYKF